MTGIRLKKVLCLIVTFTFLLFHFSYADIIRVSKDINPNYNKDFNGDGKYVLVLDPGHGGVGNVAHRGIGFYETNDAESYNTGYEADYYGVIKAGARNRVPTVIVEHAFFSNDYDFALMQDDEILKEIARREAKAIKDWFFE